MRSQSTGFLSGDEVVSEAGQTVTISDFPVNGAKLPHDVLTSPTWEKLISTFIGDRTLRFSVDGYTDCVGATAEQENLALRQQRADTVFAAMPKKAQSRRYLSGPAPPSEYLDSNGTKEGRARNRAVKLVYLSVNPKADAGAVVAKAQSIDEYLYLVRSLERRLNLTAPGDGAKALSVLRQIYYGTGGWGSHTSPFWGGVITAAPWSPGSDPTSALGRPLMQALKASQVVDGTDIGHVLTGLDAMMKPGKVQFHALLTPQLPNEAAATWAGDIATAARAWVMQRLFLKYDDTAEDLFDELAKGEDLTGDLDAFGVRAGLNPAQLPPSQLGHVLNLQGTLSDVLMGYFRTTNTPLGQARHHRIQSFVEAYGAHVKTGTIQNPDDLKTNLRPHIREFAWLMLQHRLYVEGKANQLPQGHPDSYELMERACTIMTGFFVTWLAARLRQEWSA